MAKKGGPQTKIISNFQSFIIKIAVIIINQKLLT